MCTTTSMHEVSQLPHRGELASSNRLLTWYPSPLYISVGVQEFEERSESVLCLNTS